MKAISIRQPWASLIVHGYKKYEFRSWRTKFRGRVLIHASGGVEKKYLKRFESLNLEYPVGAILGYVEITDCVAVTSELEDKLLEDNEMVYGVTHGRSGYGFKVENPVRFDKVIPANGALSFWDFYTPEEVLELMDDIKYGWTSEEGIFYDKLDYTNADKYKLFGPREIIKRGTGVCWDQVELERYYLKNNKLDVKTYFLYYEDGINDESHTFLTYKKDGKFYWMEHAWNAFVGIHEYGTMNELLQDVKKKFVSTFLADAMIEERLHCYLYDKPRGVLTVDEFYLHCKEGELIQL